eukprot:jgi/Phyca11/107552/e_gw1.13.411.1
MAKDCKKDIASPESTRPEYVPRKRSSKHLGELKSMQLDREEIINVVPPFPSLPIHSWEEFDKVFETYKDQNNLKLRNHTHSHPTTASEASSYLTTKTLPLDEQDREDVKTLADARVSSKHISSFLNERIGM